MQRNYILYRHMDSGDLQLEADSETFSKSLFECLVMVFSHLSYPRMEHKISDFAFCNIINYFDIKSIKQLCGFEMIKNQLQAGHQKITFLARVFGKPLVKQVLGFSLLVGG